MPTSTEDSRRWRHFSIASTPNSRPTGSSRTRYRDLATGKDRRDLVEQAERRGRVFQPP